MFNSQGPNGFFLGIRSTFGIYCMNILFHMACEKRFLLSSHKGELGIIWSQNRRQTDKTKMALAHFHL